MQTMLLLINYDPAEEASMEGVTHDLVLLTILDMNFIQPKREDTHLVDSPWVTEFTEVILHFFLNLHTVTMLPNL